MRVEFKGAEGIKEQLLFFRTPKGVSVSSGEAVTVRQGRRELPGRIIELSERITVIEILGDSRGLSPERIRVSFSGKPFTIKVSPEMKGRQFNAYGEPIDGRGEVEGKELDVTGRPINPSFRLYPREMVHTGISAVDGLNTLVKGQKLPIFSVSGVPVEKLVLQLVNQIRAGKKSLVVLGAIGLRFETAELLRRGLPENSILFLSLASEPPAASVLLPRSALTAAEFFAFEEGYDVVVILFDMTNYCDALRELSSSRGEIPGRKGYPAYMYSDLATIYERAGIVKGKEGSLTQIPVLTMPDDDITHPIPDLTGYITEGQIVLDRDLSKQGVYPPIDILSSLSRLMNRGVSKLQMRWAAEIFSAYANFKRVERLASIIGEGELGEEEKRYLEFGRAFQREFLSQREDEGRSLEETVAIGWRLLKKLPGKRLTQLRDEDFKELEEIERRIGI